MPTASTPPLLAKKLRDPVPMDSSPPRTSVKTAAPVVGFVHRDKPKGKATTATATTPEIFTLTSDNKKQVNGLPPPCFRIETADSGYKVRLDFYDDDGKRRRPYCCYLKTNEARTIKGYSFEQAAPVILKRIDERTPKNEAERAKIDNITKTIERLANL